MNRNIERYIETAMVVLEDAEKTEKGRRLNKVYRGYLSSLGASVRISGLVPTLAFFSSKDNSSSAERWKTLDWIALILQKGDQQDYTEIGNGEQLFILSRKENIIISKLEKDVLDASVALKLCIRTFELAN